jgi:hypothetical protein
MVLQSTNPKHAFPPLYYNDRRKIVDLSSVCKEPTFTPWASFLLLLGPFLARARDMKASHILHGHSRTQCNPNCLAVTLLMIKASDDRGETSLLLFLKTRNLMSFPPPLMQQQQALIRGLLLYIL